MDKKNGKVDNKIYDVFISHKSGCKPWVRVLARNLKEQGYKVFLDEWELVPGKSIVEGLYYKGLKQSKKGILVATTEASKSGWVMEEYKQMMIQKQQDKDFVIIPLVLGKEIPDFPFMKDILWVDFRDPDKYRESFYLLLCAIEGKSPGPDWKFEGDLTLPQQSKEPIQPKKDELSFLEGLFELFFTKQALVLLAQEDQWEWEKTGESQILECANKRFGKKNIFNIFIPYSPKITIESYFSYLGQQCGFSKSTTSSALFLIAFQKQLDENRKIFLMIRGFENSYNKGQEELVGVLRNLNERFQNLKILICGGEILSRLCHSGDLSYLNHVEIIEWPEMTVDDVLIIAQNRWSALNIDDKAAEKLLDFSGGHFRLLERCFKLYNKKPAFNITELANSIINLDYFRNAFTAFIEGNKKWEKICELLNNDDVGPSIPYIHDALLSKLYWKGLLKRGKHNKRLYWRCEALRMAGKQILKCRENDDL